MEKVIITSRKILFATWNEKASKWEKKDISKMDKPLAYYFPHPVELGEGVTIEDVLRLLESYESEVSSLFSGYLQDCTFKELLLELDKDPIDDLTDKLDCIEFYWNANLIPVKEYVDYKMTVFPSIRGIESTEYQIDHDEDSEEESYNDDINKLIFDQMKDMALTPLKDCKNITLIINDEVEYVDLSDQGTYEESILFTASREWTFFDLTTCLFTELSIYGSPKEQEKIIKEIDSEILSVQILEAPEFFEYLDEN